jgi:Rad3-related DNA helicase
LGKSLIALIASECLYEILAEKKSSILKNDDKFIKNSYIIAHTNTLLDQYDKSYSNNYNIIKVMGRSNYPCLLVNGTAEDCIKGKKTDDEKTSKLTFMKKCDGCEYHRVKISCKHYNHFLTNYSYYFTKNLNASGLENRLITVFDETHLLNDQFVGHMKIEITTSLLEKYKKEAEKNKIFMCIDDFNKMIHNIHTNKITDDNYKDHLEELAKIYCNMCVAFKTQMDDCLNNSDFKEYSVLNKLYSKYDNNLKKIVNFFEYEYEHILDIQEDKILVSPIFMSNLFHTMKVSHFTLFMSATIDKEYINTILGLSDTEMAFINAGSIFDKENKTIIFHDIGSCNYNNMSDKYFLKEITNNINLIINEHKEEKGIILPTTFKLGALITKELEGYFIENNIKMKIFSHESDMYGLKTILDEFKKYKHPAVLISPSIYEGISLDDELSRFQIIIKAPYPDLKEKRNRYILENYKHMYEKFTLYKLVQGMGRSVRNEDDWCTVHCLDSNISRVFNTSKNIWKSEFKTYYVN